MSGDYHFGKGSKKIFDLLIYRCQEKQYCEEQKRDKKRDADKLIRALLDPPLKSPITDTSGERVYFSTTEEERAKFAADLRRDWDYKHGGPWTFNEAVGLISIFVAPYKLGGLLYFTEGRIMRHMKRRRVFLKGGKLFEFNVSPEEDAETIYRNLRRWLRNMTSNLHFMRGRVIDFEPLDVLGPHIDWIGITHRRPDDEVAC